MPIKNGLFAVFLAQFLLTPLATAQNSPNDAPGSEDYAQLDRFPESTIVEYEVIPDINYQLALGRLQRITGQVVPELSEHIRGRLTRITYEIPRGYNAGQAYEYYREQLLEAGQTELFSCQGRRCGSSNYWANDIFDNRILYGPVAGQYYMAVTDQVNTGEATTRIYQALYVITRGNRRVYAHIDILEAADSGAPEVEASPVTVVERLQEGDSYILQNISFSDDRLAADADLSVVINALDRDVLLDVYIVAHLREEAPLEALLERSQSRAEQIRERLIEEGVSGQRVIARGIGPLAPACRLDDCDERVELVRQP